MVIQPNCRVTETILQVQLHWRGQNRACGAGFGQHRQLRVRGVNDPKASTARELKALADRELVDN